MEEALKVIEMWANSSDSYLSESTPYAQGYKDGIKCAKATIIEIIKQCENEKKN